MTAAEFIVVAGHNESRCHVRPGDSELTALIARVRSEYRESPGLSLTPQQVCRLWQLDCETRDVVLQVLVLTWFLRQTKNGMFVRADVER
jgi:hypothetical protein